MHRKIRKRDMIFLLVTAVVCLVLLGYYYLGHGDKGAIAVVTVDGEVYGEYQLDEDQVVEIKKDGKVTNTLTIADQKADMTDADCPDLLCVQQKAISRDGETIVCLPNKVVVTVESNEKSDMDAVAN
ncbi:NusG domain II-containing protein [Roseburia sp. MUC/MUC-530-WT-4D]|uniref:NusG domain II-containing protein n=2 Tax=Roseburia porci TaxID=2605790 RepID=A0A6L5YTV5_9FIRM|nr:NusG domain II-containing protein [Roseburia porci]